MAIEKVLIVDDAAYIRLFLGDLLKQKKIDFIETATGASALELLRKHYFDLIICDMKTSGLEVLRFAKEQNSNILVILTEATPSIESSAKAMRLGAFHYLLKPFSKEAIEAVLTKAQEHATLLEENQFLRQEVTTQSRGKMDQVIAESMAMKQLLEDVTKIAKSNASVFISGESGTGKEVIAHAIHMQSSRKMYPYIKVNCAAIPETLIESEFFGHEKGSFTGAIGKRMGRFELANHGTLLLDEITEIPLGLQAKLLRVIQEQEFERVGGVTPIHVDVRLVSTSNRNMKEAIDQKIFREDLYYRLNVVPIHLLPLRERREDIIPLAEYFLERLCSENHKNRKRFSEKARKKLLDYHWPGNIRELANIIERTVVMDSSDMIQEETLFLDSLTPLKSCPIPISGSLPIGITLQELEKRLVLETLAAHSNNRTKTAQILGISIRTLRNKLNQYKSVF